MVLYSVAPVCQPLVQEPLPLLQQAGDQDRDWDLFLQCSIDKVNFLLLSIQLRFTMTSEFCTITSG